MAPVDTGGGGLYTRHVISTPADLPVGERPARAALLPETRLERARGSLHRGRVRTGPETGAALSLSDIAYAGAGVWTAGGPYGGPYGGTVTALASLHFLGRAPALSYRATRNPQPRRR